MSKLINLDTVQLNTYISTKKIYEEILYNQNLSIQSYEVQKQILEIVQQYKKYFQQVESKKTYRESKDKINATLQMLFRKLKSKIDDLEEEFYDIHYRIYNFGLVQKLLDEIVESLDETNTNEKYLMRISIIIHDLIKKVKPENLSVEHLDIIKQGLLIITSGKATRDDVRNIDNNLLNSGLDWIYGG
ncbi:MAG: hypothetical protein HPY74_11840 [Firmicutes bacterium]|nr:hypothetical protein [Bacillota bacterium]